MVLRCSLLGHDYGEADVEREREERGSEVIVTVTEYEECSRCGDRHLISENTEVTSLSSGTAASAPSAPPTDTETAPEPAHEDETADAGVELIDEGAEQVEPADETTDRATDATVDRPDDEDEFGEGDEDDENDLELPTDENGEPITDDAEILEDSPEPDRNRGHGEWPESEDVGPPVGADEEPAAWPDADEEHALESTADAEDGAYEPAPEEGAELLESTGDTAFLDADADPEAGVDAEATEEGDHSTGSSEPPTGIVSAQTAPLPGDSEREDVPTEFFCPRCSFLAPGDRGSLRPGDICPECRRGYLGERERQSLR